ncbi:molecular chaperone Tir [Fulvivirga sp. M361]|uniref:YbjN domain-containing protein n=1 Tax=Fulvivirga sp. M361 TaxID=2594266 RepID=UPI00117A956E|nr:YbjN domain-containing protein [Fulvivirga sp. M361]TRX50668.1 molecular chaperone Tir [Fulvivirga sp. M361]
MNDYFQRVKEYLLELGYNMTYESEEDGVIVIENAANGISNLVIGVADPILIIEQFLFDLKNPGSEVYKQLLQKNRDIVHGAFVLDETGSKVIFRNTHELENLDLNELEATLNSLALLLGEYSQELIKFSEQ